VYSTLNDLTESNNFPQVENEQINFVRNFEQDTRLSLVQPIFNPSVYYNAKIQKELTRSASIDRKIYERNLVAEIKTAYFNHLKAKKWLELLEESKILIKVNIRVNKSLYENNKVTLDYIYRSEAEAGRLEQQIVEARKNIDVSGRYFNFLINKPLDSGITIDWDIGRDLPEYPGIENIQETTSDRSEIRLLNTYTNANELNQKLNKANYLPTLSLAADYGFEGEEYNFNSDSDFAMLSLVFQWNIFSGNQRNIRVQKTQLQGETLKYRKEEVKKQLELQINAAFLDLSTSLQAIEAAKKQQRSAELSFKLINKKYNAGQTSLLEYLDAQTTLTNARENYWLEVYNYYIKMADYEREIERRI
jgi:outer membrane protein TolC